MTTSTILSGPTSALADVFAVQKERARLYRRLDDDVRAATRAGDESMFRLVIAGTVSAFNAASERVRAAESSLRTHHLRPDLAQLLDHMQGLEKRKLELYVIGASLKRAESLEAFHWQGAHGTFDPLEPPESPLYESCEGHSYLHHSEEQADAIDKKRDVTADSRSSRAGDGDHHVACEVDATTGSATKVVTPKEPTEAEFRGAVAEVTVEMQRVVEGIVEVVEDLRYAWAEFEGDET